MKKILIIMSLVALGAILSICYVGIAAWLHHTEGMIIADVLGLIFFIIEVVLFFAFMIHEIKNSY